MGYSFTLESANIVANLTFGRVLSCYREIYSSEYSFWGFKEFLNQFSDNMYSDNKHRYIDTIRRLEDLLDDYGFKERHRDFSYDEEFDRDLLKSFEYFT